MGVKIARYKMLAVAGFLAGLIKENSRSLSCNIRTKSRGNCVIVSGNLNPALHINESPHYVVVVVTVGICIKCHE